MLIKNMLKLFFGVVLSLLFSTMAHELYHVYQLKHNETLLEGSFGWVTYYVDHEADHEISETIPTILTFAVGILFTILYIFVVM